MARHGRARPLHRRGRALPHPPQDAFSIGASYSGGTAIQFWQGKIDDLLSTPDTRIEFSGLPAGEAVDKVTAAATNHNVADGILQVSVKGEDVDGLIDYARSKGAKVVSVMPHRRTLAELFRETVAHSGDSEVVS